MIPRLIWRVYRSLAATPRHGPAVRRLAARLRAAWRDDDCDGELWKRFCDERPPLRPALVETRGEWQAAPGLPHHHGAALRSDRPGDGVRVRLPACREGRLLLLRHGWSGAAEVIRSGARSRYELRRESPDLLEVPVPGLAASGGEVELVNASAGDDRERAQLWLIGFRCDETLWPVELGTPLSRELRLIEGRVGHFLALRTDIGVADSLSLHGVWGAEEVAFFAECLRPGMNAIDVGAHIGHHSVAMGKLVAPGGRVLCVEPQRELARVLAANLALNGIAGGEVARVLVGEAEGEARLSPIDYGTAGNFGAVDVARGEWGGEAVSMTTLDALVAQHFGEAPVHFVKIDAQSYELFVLRGGRGTLERHRPILQAEISPYWMKLRGYDYREVYALLSDLGYAVRSRLPWDADFAGVPEWDGETDIEWNIRAWPGESGRS